MAGLNAAEALRNLCKNRKAEKDRDSDDGSDIAGELVEDRHLQTVAREKTPSPPVDVTKLPRSQPIPIPGTERKLKRGVSEFQVSLAPSVYLADGTRPEYKDNEFGEPMPIMPEIARPSKTSIRTNSIGPSNSRWNVVTESWISSNQNTSRGTWGTLKPRADRTRQSQNDEAEVRGLFNPENELAAMAGERCNISPDDFSIRKPGVGSCPY